MNFFPQDQRLFVRLKAKGFKPSVVYDLGASTGIWSETISVLLPQAEFHLFEPLAKEVPKYRADLELRLQRQPKFHLHPVALADSNGSSRMTVFRDGYDSSLHDPGDYPSALSRVEVPLARLDDYVSRHRLPAPDAIKIDCQGVEDRILRGAEHTLQTAKVLILETWFERGYSPAVPLITEIVDFLKQRGFALSDFGERFYNQKGHLYSIDAVFFAESLIQKYKLRNPSGLSLIPLQTAELEGTLAIRHPALGRGRTRGGIGSGIEDATAIVSHIEVNEKHGVGALLERWFAKTPGVISIRSKDHYRGMQRFGDLSIRLSHGTAAARDAVYSNVLEAVGEHEVTRVLCVPYFPDDARTAIALKDIFNVPLCTYLMDDQNIESPSIPDDVMQELLEKSSLRLAISPEMLAAYSEKYKLPFAYMPPLAPGKWIEPDIQIPSTAPELRSGIMVGNLWGGRAEPLRLAMRNSGVRLAWYSRNGARELSCTLEELAADGIFHQDDVDDRQLVEALRQSWFAVLPVGNLDQFDNRRELTRFSLPSRLIYITAASHTPVIVLGSPESPAAHFVSNFGIGLCAAYTPESFGDAVTRITDRRSNLRMRRKAAAMAARFSDAGAGEWLWQSLELGRPLDRRFEDLTPDPARSAGQTNTVTGRA